jgi:putative colanic acid biosysnthesis UDP-glucose lipid carrier transferase
MSLDDGTFSALAEESVIYNESVNTNTPVGNSFGEISLNYNKFYYNLVKFIEDYLISSIILILISPLMLVIAILIKITSNGPVFYRQTRVGKNGKRFRVYKFRTMRTNQESGFVKQAYKSDSRITKVGRIIRRTSLDELPQLFNILRGEMSLIGPRPHAESHDIEFSRHNGDYLSRQLVKPGITGLAQIKGFRGEIKKQHDIEGRINSDLEYIKSWSLYLDIKIIMLTFIKGFVHKNAY